MPILDEMLEQAAPFTAFSEQEEEREEVYRERVTMEMQVAQPLFAIGIKDVRIPSTPADRMKRNATLHLLNSMLFNETGSFYYDLLREGVIMPGMSWWFEHNRQFSFSSLSGTSADPETVYRRFCDYVEQVKKDGVDEKDLERCRRAMYAGVIKVFDSTDSIANTFLGDYVFNDFDMLDYPDIIRSVTTDDIMELLRDMFVPSHYTLATVYPLKENENG